MDNNIFSKFSENLKKTLVMAEKISQDQKSLMDTEHQLIALLFTKNNLAYEILTNNQISADRVQLIVSLMGKPIEGDKTGVTENAKEAIQKAVQYASKNYHSLVDCEHLLLALLSSKKYRSYTIIERIGLKPTDITKQIDEVFNTTKNLSEINQSPINMDAGFQEEPDFQDMPGPMPFGNGNTATKQKKESTLQSFTTNITAKAKLRELDPVVGRELEIERIMQILCRRTKNNPILVGDPGVGKTSVVEGLAQRISQGKVSPKLFDKEILSLDMGALVAGTMYRGQFEGRIKKILAEIKKRKNILLFIDEIHTVIGAGSTEGSIDAANILKPALGRGEVSIIGATTYDEYKKHIEKDPAFERRLQPVKVVEPSVIETIKILKGIKERYEKFHRVKYSDEALIAAAKLAKRYINDRFLPDKAIDLIDEAASKITSNVSPDEVRLYALRNQLLNIHKQKEDFIFKEEYEKATLLKGEEAKTENEVSILNKKCNKQQKTVTEDNIAEVVSRWTGIPVTNLTEIEKKKFINFETNLMKSVIGQDEAVTSVALAIKKARVGISDPSRPTGSFIFLGPTGVGKTELAKVIAKELSGNENSLVKIDMSEFMERHNVSRLVGAPAGYVGYEEGGKLTEIVRRNPYSVILLDEIEKAHPEVFNILLQIMEDGTLTDAKGRVVDFRNTILIMTSNLGSEFLRNKSTIGFGKNSAETQYDDFKENVIEVINKHFKAEFINRLDKILVFKPLDKEAIRKITTLQIKMLEQRLKETGLKIKIDKKSIDWIAERGFSPEFGARPLRKVISDYIETPTTEGILNEEYMPGDTLIITLLDDVLKITK